MITVLLSYVSFSPLMPAWPEIVTALNLIKYGCQVYLECSNVQHC